MRTGRWFTVGLFSIIGLLVVTNGILLGSLRQLSGVGRSREVAAQLLETRAEIAGELSRLAGERARLASEVEKLQEVLRGMGEARSVDGSAVSTETATDAGNEDPELASLFADFADSERPDPASIPRLTPEAMNDMIKQRMDLPRDMAGEVLLAGDVDAVLENRQWNPTGRSLEGEERAKLEGLLKRYRYFARLSPIERFKKYVEPQVPLLREAGAFIEYPANEGPPAIEGVYVSHAETSDRAGMLRLYYFYPEDYPQLAHQERVEQERGLETYLEVYSLLNPAQEGARK